MYHHNCSTSQERLENQAVNQPCLLVYTSGTTGNPKGVMVSQAGLMADEKKMYNALFKLQWNFHGISIHESSSLKLRRSG
jgi:long-subunit acyl-CoA synthetase (AMP-forming)